MPISTPNSTTHSAARSTTHSADAFWNVLGSLVYSGCQWGVLIATVKLSSAVDAGRLSLGFAISAPVFLLLQLRLRAASATDAQATFSAADYISLRALCTLLACALTLALCFVSGLSHDERTIVLWVAIAKAIECGSDLMYGLLQQADRMRPVALSMTLRGLLGSTAFAFVLARTHRLDLALAGLSASWLLVFLGFDLAQTVAANDERWRFNTSVAKLAALTRLTLPLGLSTMFMSLMANMPRYFIQHTLGLGVLGIFSAAGYLTMTVSIIISALAEAGIARMARLFAEGHTHEAARLLQQILGTTIALSAASIAASLLFGRVILKIVYHAEYGSAAGLLTGLLLAGALANIASVYGYALLAARRFMRYLGCLALASSVAAAACACLIPHWGLKGAVWACLLGYGVQCCSSWYMLRKDMAPRRTIKLALSATSSIGY